MTIYRDGFFSGNARQGQLHSSMGLAICRSIMRLLGGRIWLDTDYTGGARFIFEVPKRQA